MVKKPKVLIPLKPIPKEEYKAVRSLYPYEKPLADALYINLQMVKARGYSAITEVMFAQTFEETIPNIVDYLANEALTDFIETGYLPRNPSPYWLQLSTEVLQTYVDQEVLPEQIAYVSTEPKNITEYTFSDQRAKAISMFVSNGIRALAKPTLGILISQVSLT